MKTRTIVALLLVCLVSNNSFAKKHELKRRGTNDYQNVISFERKKDISFWDTKDSKLQLSGKHYKHGKQSLKWSFASNQKLISNHADIVKASSAKNGGMKAWIYNEKPIDGYLKIKVGNEKLLEAGEAPYEFGFRLNYSGWRAFWVHFKEDAKNENVSIATNEQIDLLEITAPASAGELYWDNVEFTDFVSWKRSDDHFKMINNEIDHFGLRHPWEYSNFWSKQAVTPANGFEWNKTVEKEIEKIEERYKNWILGDNPDFAYKPLKIRKGKLNDLIVRAKDIFKGLNIKRQKDGTLIGEALYTIREGHWPYYADLSMAVLLQLALDYKLNGNEQSLEDCLLALDFMNDQGWAYGSSMGTIDHELLRHAGYFHAIYLLKDELKKTGRLEREIETAKWFLNWGELYNMPHYVGCTADFMRSVFMYRLLIVLSQDKGAEKLRDMTLYSKWINNSMRIAPGFADTFKPDFTGYHHRGVYMNAYSPGAFHLAAVVSYLLHGTSFEVKADRIENLRQALITARIMNCKYSIPLGVCARFPKNTSNFSDILPAMAYLLKINPNDKQLLSYYKNWWEPESKLFKRNLFNKADSRLAYYHTLGAIQIMNEVERLNGETAKRLEGNWFKPYAGLSIHRRDNWMVSAKGWSSYIWDFESGTGENVFGRYEGWGAIQFFTAGTPIDDRQSGYMPDKGWDWSRIPGTTVIKLPLGEMKHSKRNSNSKLYSEGKHRNFTDQVFLGGVSNRRGNGVFANKIHDTAFNPSFWARKSYFFFDNLVVCLGDGIKNNDKEHETETTVFQIFDHNIGLKANNKSVERGEFETTERMIFEAPDNNTYVIPEGQQLAYHYKTQESISESGKTNTEGDYYTACLKHGKAPKGEAYEYAVIVDAKNTELSPDALNYKVVRKDKRAHIVKHKKETAYVIWDEELELNKGILSSLSTPGIAMFSKTKKGIEFAFSDPDLRRPKTMNISGMPHETVIAESYPQVVRICLNGKFKLNNSEHIKLLGYFNGKTILEVNCINGNTYFASLNRMDKQ
jgi:hypothetical protein